MYGKVINPKNVKKIEHVGGESILDLSNVSLLRHRFDAMPGFLARSLHLDSFQSFIPLSKAKLFAIKLEQIVDE